MFFKSVNNKTVKELRKNKCLTARELALKVGVDTSRILMIDDLKLKDVKEPLKSLIEPVLTGDETDKIPWL